MLNDNTVISVQNRDSGYVGYVIPETGVQRKFAPGETKKIPMKELRTLSWIPGGDVLLKDYLTILNNKEAVEELVPGAEPEYFMNEEGIKDMLLNGSTDELKDFLDFAPEGAINILKDLAVNLKINDLEKRNIITKQTGFNISGMIAINEMTDKDEEPAEDNTPKRRVQKEEEPKKPVRRTASKYTV